MADMVKDAVIQGGRLWMQHYKNKDFTALSTLYTEDCKLFLPGTPVVIGRKGVENAVKGISQSGVAEIHLETVDVLYTKGDRAVEEGKSVMYDQNHKELDIGKYLVVWKNVNGKWYLHQDMVNSNGSVEHKNQISAKEIVDGNNKIWEKLFQAADFKFHASLYTPDCHIMPAGQAPKIGREECEKLWEEAYTMGAGSFKLECLSATFMGDNMINDQGTYTMYDKKGSQMDQGNYIVIWKKLDDGKWYLHYDIFNSDASS